MRRRYGKTLSALVVVGAIVLVAFLAFYFWSDVFRTKLNTAARDFSEWTPDNIAKDPVNYLNFCEDQTTKAMTSLKASEIAIGQNRAKLVGMKEDAENKVGVGEKALGELKTIYLQSEEKATWPAEWRGETRDKDWVKRQIVALHNQCDGQKKLVSKIAVGVRQLDAQALKAQEGRAKAQEQLAEITTNREMLKVQKLTADLTERLVSMKGALQATLSTATEATGVISLEQLAREETVFTDSSAFDKIMGTSNAQTRPR
ncbi:MAG: hypothetical protein NTV86_01695 [Planctomycetota bacterium]|nr:hypothetical protein [Planctomycetota bacterium]